MLTGLQGKDAVLSSAARPAAETAAEAADARAEASEARAEASDGGRRRAAEGDYDEKSTCPLERDPNSQVLGF